MALLPTTVNFDEVWSKLEVTIKQLVTGVKVAKDVWGRRFTDVYYICIAYPRPLGDKLYVAIKSCLEDHVTLIHEEMKSGGDSMLLSLYHRHWQQYSSGVPYLNQLFGFLNTQCIKKFKYSEVDINYAKYGIEYADHMLEIGELALDVWERVIVHEQADQLMLTVLLQIQNDRMGQRVDEESIQTVITSLVSLLQFKPKNQMRLYEDLFEIFFFKCSTEFFVEESRRLRDSCDCSEFMEKVLKRVRDEEVLCRKYLHASSYNKISTECQYWLLIDNIAYLNEHAREKVQRERWPDLSNMYQLLSTVPGGLDVMAAEFEEHLRNVGLAVMHSLQGDDLATQFVESMLEFHKTYTNHIKLVFSTQQKFVSALDKACMSAINYRRTSKAICRSPELLAKYCDDLLKKSAKSMSESEMDERLNQIITLFKYLDDKDIFQRFYSRGMAKRLIFAQSQSMDTEESMINRLKQVCGYEYTSKLHRMFTDMTISSDLSAKFTEFLSNGDRQLQHNFTINVLQAGAWPIGQANLPTFALPQELEKSVHLFEMFYNQQYSGRKLTWMYNLCHVELKLSYRKRPYLITMEMYLMGVLLAFNNATTLSYRDLRDSSQLPNRDLFKQLHLLIDAKILTTEGDVTDESVFNLNLNYNNKRTKFKILPVTQAEVIQEAVQTHVAVEEDRRMYIQAAIVRIMKARRELKHSQLIQEVITQARTRFTPRISTIKKCIEVLMEKQYIERSTIETDNYTYIA